MSEIGLIVAFIAWTVGVYHLGKARAHSQVAAEHRRRASDILDRKR